MDIIKDLSCQKEELSEEIRQLKERYTSLQTELDTSIKARKKIEADASNAKRSVFKYMGFLLIPGRFKDY